MTMTELTSKKIIRDKFTFYKSYYDIYKELPIKDRLEFIETIMAIYFLEKKLEDIKPSTPMLKLAFSSINHSIKTSIKGFFDKMKIDYNSYPWQGAYEGACQQYTINNKQQAIDNKQQITNIYSDDFMLLWDNYPSGRRNKKSDCYSIYKKLTEEQKKEIVTALDNYKKSDKVKGGFIKNSDTWFRDWDSWIDNKPKDILLEQSKQPYKARFNHDV